MKKIVIMTHSSLAKGAKETLEFLAGDQNTLAVCCFTEVTNIDEYITKLLLEKLDGDVLMIFTDLKGGSVNQSVARKLDNNDFYLITGFNLALLLELTMADESIISTDYIKQAIQSSKEDITLMNSEIDFSKEVTNSTDSFFE